MLHWPPLPASLRAGRSRRRLPARPTETEGRRFGNVERLRDPAHAGSGASRGAPERDRRENARARGTRRRHVALARRVGPAQARVRDRAQGGGVVPPADVRLRARDARGALSGPEDHGRRHAPHGRPPHRRRPHAGAPARGCRPRACVRWSERTFAGGGLVMANINRVVLVGNLTKDPELRHTPSGTAVCKLRIAVNTRQKDAQGNWGDKPNYFDVTVWGNQGESCAQFLSKGRPVGVDGRLDWREWEAQDGTKRQAVEIIADTVQFLGGRGDGEGGGERQFFPAAATADTGADFGGAGADDDIPF